MLRLRRIFARLYGFWRISRIEQEVGEEMRFHLRMAEQENVRRGMSPEDARVAAEHRFGNLARIKEAAREIRGGGLLETLMQDLLRRPVDAQ